MNQKKMYNEDDIEGGGEVRNRNGIYIDINKTYNTPNRPPGRVRILHHHIYCVMLTSIETKKNLVSIQSHYISFVCDHWYIILSP